jgi:hypothetical protein
MSISLFVSHPCLTFLNSACTSFTPNQVYPLVRVYHRAISWRFHKCLPFALVELVYRWFWASTLHGVGPFLSHVVMISLMPSCICHVQLSKRMSSSIAPRIDSVWKFLPRWVMSSSTLEFEKVLFHSEYPIELMDHEDRVLEHNIRRAMKHNPILQGAMSFMHGRKSCMGNREVSFFQRSRYLRFFAINASFIVSCAPPPFVNIRTRFLLRGEDYNTPCYEILNHQH